METIRTAIERGFSLLHELVREDARLEAELEQGRGEFFGSAGTGPHQPHGERRFLEWFLLERPSVVLAGVPALVLQETWCTRLGGGAPDVSLAFLQSLAGAFEVTSTLSGEGIWVRDLFGLGEYPILEPDAAPELERGDLLVGRLFPADGGVFCLSPAVCCYRNPRLLEAVRSDLERMRRARRGVLRVQQIELERLFFRPASAHGATVGPSNDGVPVRSMLLAGGLAEDAADGILVDLDRAAAQGDGAAITEVLNRLAFETHIDLEVARRALAEYWTERRAETEGVDAAEDRGVDPRGALEAFDRGRSAGADLEQLFRTLEQELGVEVEEPAPLEEGDSGGVPDFPGVVGAMVEEFLWDVKREQGEAVAQRWAGLRRLGTYGREIGIFEDLGPRQLLDFAGRWLLDEGDLPGPEEAREVLDALGAFCRWSEERHAHPLWGGFGKTLQALRRAVPRLSHCRGETPSLVPSAGAYRLTRIEETVAFLEEVGGGERRVPVTPGQRTYLRPGDIVRLGDRHGVAHIAACYPAALLELLP